ncbi:hypothetical protein OKW35_000336 [Paraburkholderia sp. MM5477-R1]
MESATVTYQQTSDPAPLQQQRWKLVLRNARLHTLEWGARDGLIWLHLAKAVTAALLALGIAMTLELPQPRTAMVTVFVLMQP